MKILCEDELALSRGAEPVQNEADALHAFDERAGVYGLTPASPLPVVQLAETPDGVGSECGKLVLIGKCGVCACPPVDDGPRISELKCQRCQCPFGIVPDKVTIVLFDHGHAGTGELCDREDGQPAPHEIGDHAMTQRISRYTKW